ncbi:hypothetical protein ISN44_As13g004980 [Arabidopsis suecica]|uniref:DUF1985 domain-containing protein n=1 Tax=Arabidopsis suecica TaxID=45249 RepID=A0A8T1XPF2_ARASU|nr:hypothetical protein ISN44_As13g004980 [Arabidopsis suecica]
MGDSFPTYVTLPKLLYNIGQEPNSDVKINQCARYEYIKEVQRILSPTEFQRIRESFLGPALKATSRGLNLSGKLIHCFLARSLTIEADENVEENRYGWANTSQRHTSEELLDILRETNRDSGDETFLLAMLLLTECIFLNMFKGNRFPAAHLKRAQDVHQFLNYPWGIDAFKVMLSSIKSNVPCKLLKGKYDIHGYPLGLHLWILESIPVLQSSLSRVSFLEPRTSYICERYTSTTTPQIPQIENLEASDNLNVTCILPAIPNDPEYTVSLEDEDDPELSLLVELLSKGYKMKAEDWRRGSLDVGAVMEETSQTQKTTQTEEITQKISSTNEMNKDETNAENQTQECLGTYFLNLLYLLQRDNVDNRVNENDRADEQEDNAQHEDPSLQRDGVNENDIADEQEDNAQHEDPSLQRDTKDGGVNAENREDSRPTLAQDYSCGLILMEEVEVFNKNEWKK